MTTKENPRAPIAAIRPHAVPSPNGVRIDPYYWLRDDLRADKDVLAYLEAENAFANASMAATRPLQERIYAEIVGRIKQDDATAPYRRRDYWYYRRFEVGQEYPIFVRKRHSLESSEQVMLNVNEMARGHDFFQIGHWAVSPDDRLLAWTEDSVGRRQYVLRMKNLETGEVYSDAVSNVEADIAWAADNRTVLYVAKDPVTLLGDKVRRHSIGGNAALDPLVFEQDDKAFYTSVGTTKDERYLTIYSRSTVSSELRVARSDDPDLDFEVLIPRERDHEYQAEHLDGRWILRTNWQAKNFRIVEADAARVRDRNAWRDLVAHRSDAFVDGFDVFREFLAVEEHSGGLANVRIRSWTDGRSFVIDSDDAAYSATLGVNAEIDTPLVRYRHESFATPPSTYDLDVRTGARLLIKRDPVLGGFEPASYCTEHLWATARDGTKIPISLVYHRSTRRDGTAPLLQYGYGAYGLSMDPAFSYSIASLLDRGFVYAVAHIRGGQELGRDWYESGKLLSKGNTFTDFIDATRFLVRERYADPARVFAMGGSAGGLLMGAVVNMAPQDYRGIVALVPFVDIVTTMLDESIPLTTNEFDEWGDPREKQFYEYMLTYSPYDNVTRQAYPAMFIETGLWDSQVQYYEPAKWVARLRALKTDDNPLIFRINMEAGHGGKSGRFERFREIAEQYAFIVREAGI